jgi:hypothetical protein
MELMKKEPLHQATKNDILDNKVRMDLLPPNALTKIAEVFTYGANKYEAWNWAKGLEYSRLYGALQRHLNDWYMSDSNDKETNKSHLAHAGCCIMMLLDLEEYRKDLDDRPKLYQSNQLKIEFE